MLQVARPRLSLVAQLSCCALGAAHSASALRQLLLLYPIQIAPSQVSRLIGSRTEVEFATVFFSFFVAHLLNANQATRNQRELRSFFTRKKPSRPIKERKRESKKVSQREKFIL